MYQRIGLDVTFKLPYGLRRLITNPQAPILSFVDLEKPTIPCLIGRYDY